ncbi:hypothetical protein VIMS_05671 [Mycobacterium marinum]|nr:hypothetical protein VIMS_05671 [Mycobacterium marinum]
MPGDVAEESRQLTAGIAHTRDMRRHAQTGVERTRDRVPQVGQARLQRAQPETCAGTPRPVLNAPETVSPRLAKPDCSAPTFCTPEMPDPTLRKPEVRAPRLPNPDTVPWPKLKKPDDGLVVEFPKPGAAGISRNDSLIGPTC